MTRMTEQVGRVLGGRYRLLSPLGSGASAQVYLADDVRLRRRVAVKVLHPGLAGDESFLRRFRAEAQATAALSHPHLLAVYDWSDGEDAPYLVTEYLSGGSLRGMLDAGHRLSPSQALVVGLEAARALDHAHRQGFVHRDIKPANLLFGADGRLRIADFGLAKAVAEAGWTEPAGAVLGTARYASPEQARGESVDGHSDVYSLALVLVESVTGQVPFTADTTIGTLMARLDRSLEVPDGLGPLAPVLATAGRLDPAERVDAAALGRGLVAVAPELSRPEPLPLAGALAPDDAPTDQRDATLLGPTRQAAVAHLAAVAGDPSAATQVIADQGSAATNVMHATPARPSGPVEPAAAAHGPHWPGDGRGLTPGDRSARRLMVGALVVAVALVVGVVGGWAYMQANVPSHTVPARLIGVQKAQALEDVREFGWTIKIEETREDGSEPGEVLATRPLPGTRLREDKTLVLQVSLGPTLVPLPAGLVGMDEDDAVDALEAAGLVAEIVPVADDETDEGTVTGFAGEEPAAELPRGSTVRLEVASDGDEEVEIPDLAGDTYAAAVEELEGLGLVVEPRGERRSGDQEVGDVVRTDPEEGEEVDVGSTVVVVVAIDRVQVPSVVGMSVDEARAQIEGAGLTLGRVLGPDDGVVLLTVPGTGTQMELGGTVDLVMRRGR
ncbi:MAG TPA: PASTA domain-containing protein [Acidimicrobiales bacterium]|nr:PASTA domain-containing protein [Acidimicrobiales bacterium]